MLGSLAMGYCYDKVNHLRLLGVISVINGLSSIVLPWCNIYGLFMFVRLVDGFLCGGRGGGGDATVLSRWGTESRHLTQGNHLSYGLGGVLAPLVTRLFLAPRVPPTSINTNGQDELDNISDVWNTTAKPNDTDSFSNISKISQSLNSSFGESDVVYGETKIHIAFAITGIVNIISGMLYLYLFMKKYDTIPPYTKSTVKHEVVYHRAKLTTAETAFCIFLIGVMFITFCSVESKSQSFLLPFVMLQMGWTKFDGAYLLSLLWGFFTAGRFTGVVIARFLSPRKLACICLCTVILSYTVLSVGGLLGINAIVWTIVPFAGLGLSAVFPTFVVWTHENVIEVKGKMSGFFQFVGAIGFFTDPFYIGYLMENESPMYMLYVGIAQATCSLIIFISTSLWINSRKVKAKE
ncbi:sodium-dependent glucose transporter 1B-like [Mya arenaria]|uniref:sodium-dependent glucose transporter 1B-like n=1 Tax=Mya arenaria TaxID=6604 RepID=UPI0022E072FF|nr:sodium-dependent glucose transporter 1B-like [Mya arenaria]